MLVDSDRVLSWECIAPSKQGCILFFFREKNEYYAFGLTCLAYISTRIIIYEMFVHFASSPRFQPQSRRDVKKKLSLSSEMRLQL